MEYGLLDYGKVGGDVEDFGNPNFLETISPPTTKSQTPMSTTTAPNDQELLNLFT